MSPPDLPPLGWLRAFEASARHLSFTAAAQELNMTQSAVSQHVKSLESFLGRSLFIRKTRALQLTEAGFNYLPVVRDAFSLLTAGTRALTGGDRGSTLTVQCNLALAVFWLAPRLADLVRRHPWLTLSLTTPIWDPERTAPDADVELRFGRAPPERARGLRLSAGRAYPVCAPGYELATGPERWRATPLFDCSGVLSNWEAWLASRGDPPPPGKLVHLSSTFVVSMTVAAAGGGLAMTHDRLAGGLLRSGALERPFETEIEMVESYFLSRPPRHAETPASRAFADWVTEIAELEAATSPAAGMGDARAQRTDEGTGG